MKSPTKLFLSTVLAGYLVLGMNTVYASDEGRENNFDRAAFVRCMTYELSQNDNKNEMAAELCCKEHYPKNTSCVNNVSGPINGEHSTPNTSPKSNP